MRRIILVVAAAVVLALAASTLAYRAISAGAATPPSAPARVTIPVAARDLTAGMQIQASDITTVEWPVPPNPQWAGSAKALDGRTVLENLYKGEPFLEARLAPPGAGGGLSTAIPPGMRAFSVKVDDTAGIGFVLPGMRVDVLATGAFGGSGVAVTRTVLQNIAVMPGAHAERDAPGRPASNQAITLLVTPEQAETLSLAAGQTKLQFVTRNPTDAAVVATSGTSTERLLGLAPRPQPRAAAVPSVPAPVVAPPAPLTVDVFTGTKKNSMAVGMKPTSEGPK